MLKKLFQAIHDRYLIANNPIKYLDRIGVNHKGKVYIYGGRVGMFGSEPWLITLGRNVHITGNCQFITHDGGVLILRHKYPDLELSFPIKIGDNVFIGFGSIILPGVTIGDNVIIGAGSVINKDIPSNSVAVGVPCKVVKSLDDYEKSAIQKSIGLGQFKGKEKDDALRKFYKYTVK